MIIGGYLWREVMGIKSKKIGKEKVRDFFYGMRDVGGCCRNILRIFGKNYFLWKFVVDLILQLIA